MSDIKVPDGSALYYFYPTSFLWSKHAEHAERIASLIESGLGNEDGVIDVLVERHRVVVFYSPLVANLDELMVVIKDLMQTLAEDRSQWQPFPYLETGTYPDVIASSDSIPPSFHSLYPVQHLAPIRRERQCYLFNGYIMNLVEGVLDEDVFDALVGPLRTDLARLDGIVNVSLARGQVIVTYTTALPTDLLDAYIKIVMNRFFAGAEESFPSLKKNGTSLKLDVSSVPA